MTLQQHGSLAVGDVIECRVLDAQLLALATQLDDALAGLCAYQTAAHGVRRISIQRRALNAQLLVVTAAVEVEDAAWCRAVHLDDAVLHSQLANQVVLTVSIEQAVLQACNLHVLDRDFANLISTICIQTDFWQRTHQDERIFAGSSVNLGTLGTVDNQRTADKQRTVYGVLAVLGQIQGNLAQIRILCVGFVNNAIQVSTVSNIYYQRFTVTLANLNLNTLDDRLASNVNFHLR